MATAEVEIRVPDGLPDEVEDFIGYGWDDVEERAEPPAPAPEVVTPIVARIAHRRRALAERRARVEAQAKAEMERLRAWQADELGRIDHEASRCDLILLGHQAFQMETDPKAKTLRLPYGVTCKVRAQQPEWLRDEDDILRWAVNHAPEYVENRPHLLWSKLKAAGRVTPAGGLVLPETGEVVPSVQVARRDDKRTVEVSLDG